MALVSCVEIVLMRNGNVNYNLILAMLNALYDHGIMGCYEHPEYLRIVLKEVYAQNYNSIIDQIKSELGDLVEEKDIVDFFKTMEKENCNHTKITA